MWGLLLLNVSLARGSQSRVVHLTPPDLRLTHWLMYVTSSHAAPSLSAVLFLHDFLLKVSFLIIAAAVQCKSQRKKKKKKQHFVLQSNYKRLGI